MNQRRNVGSNVGSVMTLNRLSQRKIETAKPKPGNRADGKSTLMLADGGGLYLQVTAEKDGTINRSWIYRFATGKTKISRNGFSHNVERQMGLGSFPTISLADAREKALKARKLRDRGLHPIEVRDKERSALALEAARAISFDQCATAYLAAHRSGWRSIRHSEQWSHSLKRYVSPILGHLPVQAIDTALVIKTVEPLWTTKTETANRVRGRIEAVLDWAAARGYRQGENPARWRGHLDKLLPPRRKIHATKHYAALPYDEIGKFINAIRGRSGIPARALEFTILTAARTGEVIAAMWDEIDFRARVWTIPASRTKSQREHRVPLSSAAMAVLKQMSEVRQNEFVFPGDRRAGVSNMAMDMLLRRMGSDITVHGFRSTFRDWAAERTAFPREVAEMALAHAIPNVVEAAYRRGDLFEKRRRLMEAWADYCTKAPSAGSVTTLRSAQ
jgi:integrase